MVRGIILAVALLAAPLARAASAAAPPPMPCDVPAEFVTPARPLAKVRHALAPGGRLDVLALGSGTLLGVRGGVEGSVPFYMARALGAAAPGATIHLTLHGARAESAADMLVALRKELAAGSYQLVLWQTGTVEAVRKSPSDAFAKTLADGVAAVAAAGADLVLIDVPYSRLLENKSDLQPYRAVIQSVADRGDVALFRRYDLMRHWADAGELDMEAADRNERDSTADRLRACLGQALANLLLAERGS
jgi:hypothetical protein